MKHVWTTRAVPARAAKLICALLVLACTSDRASAPDFLGELEVVSGGTQHGTSGAPLPDPIVITIVGKTGAPVSGVAVEWMANDGGVIEPLATHTDSAGHAAARWTLGTNGGLHTATARAVGYPPLTITASTPRTSPLPTDQIRVLNISTYDGSNETVHPDYARLPDSWPTGRYDYLAITPYPNANFAFENPSLYESPDLVTWWAPEGITNPVVMPAPQGYLSDPDIVYDPDRKELLLYYREVVDDNAIYVVSTSNGIVWSDRTLVARARSNDIVSPSVSRHETGGWMMWSVNSGPGCGAESSSLELRKSGDGIHWSNPQRATITPSNLYPWHVDAQWIPELKQYWAVFNAKPPFSCTTTELYLATSTDGLRWTAYPTPILSAGVIPEFSDIVYRATFAYDPYNDAVTFWYSGARFTGSAFVWSSAVQQRNRLDVIREASVPHQRAAAKLLRAGPQLTDPP